MGKQGLHEHKDGKVGGYLVGRKHTHGGIKAKNVDTNAPIELESEEVVITAPAVKSSQKHEFDGQQLTNLEILDRINVSGGGVGLMERGGTVKDTYTIHCCGKTFKYGGRDLTDREILKQMADDDYLDEPEPELLGVTLEATDPEVIMLEGGKLDGTNGYNQQPLIDLIVFFLSRPGSRYITALDSEDDRIEIRVSDHNANAKNFSGQHISFISKGGRHAENPRTDYEFIVEDEKAVHDVLKDYDIIAYYDGDRRKDLQPQSKMEHGARVGSVLHQELDLNGHEKAPWMHLVPVIDEKNYFTRTRGDFERVIEKDDSGKNKDYTQVWKELLKKSENEKFRSASGSLYVIHDGYLYRYSDHWGKVASCDWTLDGKNSSRGYALGRIKFSQLKSKIADRIGASLRNGDMKRYLEMGNLGFEDAKKLIQSADLDIPDYVSEGLKAQMGDGGHTCGCSHSFPHHLLPVHFEGGGTVPAGLNETEEETLNFFKKHPDGFVRFHAKRTDMSHLLSAGLIYKTDAASGFYTDVFLTEKGARTLRYHNLLSGEEIMVSGGKTKTIKEKVLDAQDILKAMTSHTELRNWALSNGMDNRSAFPKFKDALKGIGVDYESIRSGVRKQQQLNLVSKIKHQVTLYVDAKASHNRFGITDEDGNVLWYGKFFDNDQDYNGEQSSGELAAAKKAVWLASKIKEAVGDDAIKLILFVDAQWLTYQDHPGQKGYALTQISKKYDIDLNVEWIPGTDNPADKWTVSSGYKKWSDNDIASLAKPVDLEKEGALEAEEEDFVPEILSVKPSMMEIGTPQEAAHAGKYFKGVHYQYANPYDLNRAIEELLDSTPGIDFSVEEKVFLKYYSGYGGLEKYGAKGVGLLYEYFTPGIIAQKMWGLAYKYGYDNGSVFEPSCGIGEFFNYAPAGVPKTGYEINAYSARICKILHPDVMVENQAFEEKFIKGRDTIRNRIDTMPKYDLVIGNPPYGNFQGKFAGMGEKAYTKASNYIDYFIFRGLDLLKPGGLLIFIIGAEVQAGGIPFLQQQDNPIKREIAEKADLLDAYRLPNGVFERTDVLTDIIVLQKK